MVGVKIEIFINNCIGNAAVVNLPLNFDKRMDIVFIRCGLIVSLHACVFLP